MLRFTRPTASLRSVLLVSSAVFAITGSQAAYAEAAVGEDDADLYTSAAKGPSLAELVESSQTIQLVSRPDIAEVTEAPAITINNRFTPNDVRDPTNITGIGQIVTDAGGGSIGLCTATLINPRTVIFAAHCVNGRTATAYGANSGGVGVGIGFETNTRANAPGQPDELVNWLLGSGQGPGRFQTNRAQQFYNINQVFYHPGSLAPASCTAPGSCFLEADIATAVLDAPTRNVPTWTMLFSPLTAPGAINPATGTGYHVTIAGYGRNGTGTTGAAGSDFRRRVAENMLGALTSISARNLFLFGTTGTPNRPQLLYWLDFDDPARGTVTANPRDFNGFRDNALPREGSTGPGDSGGPLILDTFFSKQTILGVLSGGSTFFAGQPGGSYGTQSFYQPLFLYWDWIVANNPYRYVTATAGNKNWEDASAWITTLDPAYQIIAGGQLVNGVPTELGGTIVATTPQFGEVCFQSPLNSATPPATNECQNLATGANRNNVPNTPTGTGETAPVLTAVITDLAESSEATDTVQRNGAVAVSREALDGAFESPLASPGYRDGALPAPTIANGLPGATNFVPNNVEGVRATGVMGRYYDVTLSNAGTVTLNSAVTIDRFTIAGAQSQLAVAGGAALTSLIDFNQVTGIVNNNGTINSGGDYFFLSGLLTGTGRTNAPFLTSVIGNFAPGTLTSNGTMTIGGNLVLGPGSTYAVNVGGGSDLISVVANGGSAGSATLGGALSVSIAQGNTIRFGDLYTILNAQGGLVGSFQSINPLSAILRPSVIYTANAVQLQITAVPYTSVVSGTSPVQVAFANLLDANRGQGGLAAIYNVLDLADQATIRATLDALAPRTETLRFALGSVSLDSGNKLIRNRLIGLTPGVSGGSLAYIGKPFRTAAVAQAASRGTAPVMAAAGQADTVVRENVLPDDVSAFFAGGYLNGDSLPMATALPLSANDEFDGWYVGAGAEKHLSEDAVLGLALSYASLDGETGAGLGTADSSLLLGSIYGKLQSGRIALDAQLSAGLLNVDTSHPGNLPGQTYTLTTNEDALAVSAEGNLSAMYGSSSLQFGPHLGLRWAKLNFGKIAERGGPTALMFDRTKFDTFEGRAGLVLKGTGRIRPIASAHFVHAFDDQAPTFAGRFVDGLTTSWQNFALGRDDRNWGEASLGIAITAGRAEISLSADTTIERDDLSYQAYRAAVSFKF